MINDYKVACIIQARMGSTRFPGKVLETINDKSILRHIYDRLLESNYIDDIVVATTMDKVDDALSDYCGYYKLPCYRGSHDNVLDRVTQAAKEFKADIIVEITADCPFADAFIADKCIDILVNGEYDYVSNVIERTYARGFDVQVFWTKILEGVNLICDNTVDRQHVSTWIYKNPDNIGMYKLYNLESPIPHTYKNFRLTVDTKEDFEVIRRIYKIFDYFDIDEPNYEEVCTIMELSNLAVLNEHIQQKDYYKELQEWKESTKRL